MTKKHFKAFAEAFRMQRPPTLQDGNYEGSAGEATHLHAGWARAVMAFADTAKQFNPQFDRDRFYEACGGL